LYAFKFYKDANTLCVLFNGRYPFTGLGAAHIYRLTKMFHSVFVQRLRVRGRLYRIYKRNIYRDIQYRFGHTHRMFIYTEGLYVRYIRKKRIRIFGYDYKYLVDKCKDIRDVFPLNIYTRRGIRIGGERTYTRIGKTVKYY
jgi:ribosomal protein L6P/L9E